MNPEDDTFTEDVYEPKDKEIEKLRKDAERERALWSQWNEIAKKEIKKREELEGRIADIYSCVKAFPFLEFKEPVDEANFRKWFAELVFLVGKGGQKQEAEE